MTRGHEELALLNANLAVKTVDDQHFWSLPLCKDAASQYRQIKEQRIVSRGEIILLNTRQDLLTEIFKKEGLPIEENEPIDVYNPAVIRNGSLTEFLGRAEARFTKHSTLILHFVLHDGVWIPQPTIVEKLEDPALMYLRDTMVFAGVRLEENVADQRTEYKTVFKTGRTLQQLSDLRIEGPIGMKDIRFVQLRNSIGVYTRPQGELGGLGQIGFTTIPSLDYLTADTIQNAPLVCASFPEGEWGGANEAQLLPDGRVLVLGHRAYRDEKNARHYFPWMFIHDPESGEIQDLGILAESADFPPGVAKSWDLEDVLFSAGFDLLDDTLVLYVGVRDTQVGKIVLKNLLIDT